MKKTSKYKVEKSLIFSIVLFFIISVLTLYNIKNINESLNLLYIKQIMFYILGIGIIYFIMFLSNDFIFSIVKPLYIITNVILLLLLLFGEPINGAKCWFEVPLLGSFQPSEFMKIILIIYLSKITHENKFYFKNDFNEEFRYLFKCFILILIPSLLTLLQPDTGAVLMYLIIFLSITFISGIRYRWFFISLIVLIISFLSIFFIYNTNKDLFIDIFGTSFFYRMDRITDFKSGEGMQLNNALTSIGSSGIKGYYNELPLYFPEAHNDFIFALYSTTFGFIGSIFLILLLIYFNTKIINIGIKTSDPKYKFLISGFIGMILFQQIQNIGMNLGLLPIIGITLPFISYGGSSLISYMILMGLIFNISNDNIRYSN